jgi:BMFP domain-containing protein YqiC
MNIQTVWSGVAAPSAVFSASIFSAILNVFLVSSPAIAVETFEIETLEIQANEGELNASLPNTSLMINPSDRLQEQAVANIQTSSIVIDSSSVVLNEPAFDESITRSEDSSTLQAQALSSLTSVNQLSDVQPTDWAYQALQSLVERYGCVVGYPDRTYRGNTALTRYEFAAGVNACLDRISELLSLSVSDLVTRDDLAVLQRLQEEFANELAILRGRVDSLEARVAELEANQFSTTTQLQGETIFAIGVPITEDDQFNDQTIAGYRARLNFNTSFTGEDLLRARTQAVHFNNYEGFGGSVGATTWKLGTIDGDENFFLDQLIYFFPVAEQLRVTLGARGVGASDFVTSTVSPFDSDLNAVLGFGFPPSYYFIPGGVGAGGSIQLAENLAFDFGYGASNESAPDPSAGRGLFNGDYGIVTQLTFLSDAVDAFLLYGNGYQRAGFFTDLGVEGGPAVANSYGGYLNFKFGSFEVGGGVTYVPIRQIRVGDYDVWSYQAGFVIRDFGIEGSDFGIQGGVAPYASSVPIAAVSPDGAINQANSVIVQGFYNIRIRDNIRIVPSAAWISAPNNDRDNDGTVVGLVKTAFTF